MAKSACGPDFNLNFPAAGQRLMERGVTSRKVKSITVNHESIGQVDCRLYIMSDTFIVSKVSNISLWQEEL